MAERVGRWRLGRRWKQEELKLQQQQDEGQQQPAMFWQAQYDSAAATKLIAPQPFKRTRHNVSGQLRRPTKQTIVLVRLLRNLTRARKVPFVSLASSTSPSSNGVFQSKGCMIGWPGSVVRRGAKGKDIKAASVILQAVLRVPTACLRWAWEAGLGFS